MYIYWVNCMFDIVFIWDFKWASWNLKSDDLLEKIKKNFRRNQINWKNFKKSYWLYIEYSTFQKLQEWWSIMTGDIFIAIKSYLKLTMIFSHRKAQDP